MFQNISEQIDTEEIKENIEKKEKIKYISHKLFTKQNILLYIISFMISQVGLRTNNGSFWTSYICCKL